eukprot:6143602-Prymnesium_polylepis.1
MAIARVAPAPVSRLHASRSLRTSRPRQGRMHACPQCSRILLVLLVGRAVGVARSEKGAP